MDHKEFACVIDENSRYKTFVLVALRQNNSVQEEGFEIQNYILATGETLVYTAPPALRAHAGASGFVRPKWNDDTADWTEAATEEEITAWEDEHPAPALAARKPSEAEQLRADIDYLAIMTGVEL